MHKSRGKYEPKERNYTKYLNKTSGDDKQNVYNEYMLYSHILEREREGGKKDGINSRL